MSEFKVHTKGSAPEKSAVLLEQAESTFGFVPNLLGVFAESPAILKAYMTLGQIFDESSFTPVERQIVILAVSRFNECRYCVAAHSVIAGAAQVREQAIEAIRTDEPIEDERLEALRRFATAVVEKRGWVSEDDAKSFETAGFSRAQVLEVILGLAFKTLSNYVNHIAETPLDRAFAERNWTPPGRKVA